MTVISISLTPELLDRLDVFVSISGYSSRSEAIRLAVRDTLSQFALERKERGRVVATVMVISDRERHEINSQLTELHHEFDEGILSNMHLHISKDHCMEIYIVQGFSKIVLDFIQRVRAVRGIVEVRFTMTPLQD